MNRRHMRLVFFWILMVAIAWSALRLTVVEPKDPVQLGQALFSDPILSEDRSISCASCHIPEYAFSDTTALSKGVHGRLGVRNTPSAMNLLSRSHFFWDGRAATLEAQAIGPIENPVEMNLPIDSAVARLRADARYSRWFMEIYDEEPSVHLLTSALAAFEQSLETSSAYDRYMAGDEDAISESAKRGIEIFNVKGRCFECHFGPDMTGDEFRNIGLYDEIKYKDKGRFDQTKNPEDLGKFKTPGLRNVAVTGPYMHDGSFETLAQIIDYYDRPAHFLPHSMGRDTIFNTNLGLTDQEKLDLEAFLIALTADQFVHLLD